MDNFNLLPKELIMEIALEYNLPDIINYCQLSKRFDLFTCKNDYFWMNKFYHDFGKLNKSNDISWKNFYLKVLNTDPDELLWEGVDNNQLNLIKISIIRGAKIESRRMIFYAVKTPLLHASEHGYLEVVKYLVENGADIHYQNDYVVVVAIASGHLDVVKYLTENGANIRAHSDEALLMASLRGYLDIVKYLIEKGANPHAQENRALELAIMNNNLEVVDYLSNLE